MPRINVAAAKQMGFTDQQIQAYLAKRPDVVAYSPDNVPQAPQQNDGLAGFLPLAGGVAGSLLGAPLGPAGVIAGGAIGSGLGEFGRQQFAGQPTDVGGIAKEAALGGVGGVVGKVAAPIFRGGARIAGKVLGGAGEKVAQKAAQSVLNTSPSTFNNAAEVGVNLNKALIKHSPFLGNTFDDMLGPIGKNVAPELRGGNITSRIKVFENQINQVVKEAGTATKISGNEIVKALRAELASEKMVLGNDARVKILENLIKEAEKGYKNGTTVGKALSKLRIANRQFGRSILEDQTGSMISSAQKLEANVLRTKLKTLFPAIGDALDNEQELILLKEVLGGARAKTQAGSLGVAGLDITKPGSVIQFLLGNPQVGGRIARAGAGQVGEAATGEVVDQAAQGGIKQLAGQVAGQTAAQGAARLPFGSDQEQSTEDMSTESPQLAGFGEGKNSDQVKKAFLMAMMANPKQAATLQKIYDFGFGDKDGKPKSVTAATRADLAKAGERGLKVVRSELKKDPNVVIKQLVPGTYLSRQFDSALFRTVEALLRLRTGAAAPETEVRRYMKQVGPRFGDSKEVIETKLNDLEFAFQDALESSTGVTSPTLEDFSGSSSLGL